MVGGDCVKPRIDRQYIKSRCDEFYEMYKETEGKVYDMCNRKIIHIEAVAQNCAYLAESLGMSAYDTDLAWLIGELHDFARFGQAVNMHTFVDSPRYDHAKKGVKLLFNLDMIRDIVPNYQELGENDIAVIEKAILYHSGLHLPDSLTERERLFCELICEADRIDIFRVTVETGWEVMYGYTQEEILSADFSAEIAASFYRCELADFSQRKTPADYHLARIALCFGLKSEGARKKVVQDGYLQQLLSVEFSDPEVQAKYLPLKKCVEEFMQI